MKIKIGLSKQRRDIRVLSDFVLLSVVIMIVIMFCACAHTRQCMTRNADRTFVQLWRKDAQRTPGQWDKWFMEMNRLGFYEIIVQWSAYGNVSFHKDERAGQEGSPCLAAFIKAAKRHATRIWIGLDYDPDFWRAIDGPAPTVQSYLHRRVNQISQRLPLLHHTIEKNDPQGNSVKGWYISDEIDDLNWRDPLRQKALWAYLESLRSRLRQEKPAWPVLISGFSNGAWVPEKWTAFWNETLKQTGIDGFLFQDGIGAGKLTFDQLEIYLQSMHQGLDDAPDHFGVIVELFQFKHTVSSTQAVLQAADMSRVARQLELARRYSQSPITVFAAPDYLNLNGDVHCRGLYAAWKKDNATCQ